MDIDNIARARPVFSVASQGKDLLPKAIRTSGIRRTKMRTADGKEKKKICIRDLVRVFLKTSLSLNKASFDSAGKVAWLRDTPNSVTGRIYSCLAKVYMDKLPGGSKEFKFTETHLWIWSKLKERLLVGISLSI